MPVRIMGSLLLSEYVFYQTNTTTQGPEEVRHLRTSFLSLKPPKQRQSLFSSGVRLVSDVGVTSPPLSHFSFFASRSSPSGVSICFVCSGPLLTISSLPPAHEGAWTERVVNLWNSGEIYDKSWRLVARALVWRLLRTGSVLQRRVSFIGVERWHVMHSFAWRLVGGGSCGYR
ncbi:hypothetical protein F2Q68_00036359 [Brassica cretica]|uniref:Uncharacterized protein n=1 Tax=Brassica cretica TaxID=69181 RepID=A0A8S9GZW6_BRACR|nr:hypothetical protein F2Q68_00036359 [Brassica cretica]